MEEQAQSLVTGHVKRYTEDSNTAAELFRYFCSFSYVFVYDHHHALFANSDNISQNSGSIFTCMYVCMCVCMCVLKRDISIYLHCMMFQTKQTIYFLKAYHLVMTMTETNTYKKTKTHIHRQRQIQSASKTQCMLYLSKAGGSRI